MRSALFQAWRNWPRLILPTKRLTNSSNLCSTAIRAWKIASSWLRIGLDKTSGRKEENSGKKRDAPQNSCTAEFWGASLFSLIFFLAPHTIRGEVRFQGIELVGEVLDFVVEQTPHGNHAGQLAVAIDDGQMTDMFF